VRIWSLHRFVYLESRERGYHFNPAKLAKRKSCDPLEVTTGQLRYEMKHVRKKLKLRNPVRYRIVRNVRIPRPHPLFVKVPGNIEEWERAT
jgi:hypothetical protein